MSAKVIRPYNKQDKLCTYNETMWRVKVNIVPIKMKQCVLKYGWNAYHYQQYKTMLLWPIHNAAHSKTILILHVKCPTSLSDFNQIWSFSAAFHESAQYQISGESVLWETRAFIQIGGHDDATGAFSDYANASTTNRTSYKYVLIQMRFKLQLSYA